jgi:light-regulated signal transduction histidine kinase (bacteriophytochrome)
VPILIGAATLSFEPLEWICFVVDLTELKRAQQEVEKANAALQQSNGELQRFAYAASHDLQEPLRTIGAMSELVARHNRGRLGPETDSMLDHIQDGVSRMSHLISDLLEYSRFANENELPQSAIDAGEVARSAISNLQQRIAETGARVTIDDLPVVRGDNQLMRVFQNLVGNALKYRSEAAPAIHISARCEDPGWIFEVRDNGIGFEMKHAERVFQVFQRLHGRNEYSGTGIGLAICKRIVERHGGRIWVQSSPGRGSSFYFSLPAIPPSPQTLSS